MPTREGSIRITLQKGTFNSQLKSMEGDVASTGKHMGSSLSKPINAGFSSMKRSLSGFVSSAMSGIRQILTLGGTIGGAALVKNAVNLQSKYRDIAFSVSKIPGIMMEWQDVQKMVEAASDKTGRSSAKLADTFMEMFSKSGDIEMSRKAMESIGTASVAGSGDVIQLANAVDIMTSKFGISKKEINDALAGIVGLSGVGSKNLDEMTNKFAIMAGSASKGGMSGVEGMKELLGIIKLLDNKIGEGADRGLEQIFNTLEEGSGSVKEFQKSAHIKFTTDMSAMDRIKAIAASTKGLKQARETFKGPSRDVFDELVKPFLDAQEEAKNKGMSNAEAIQAGIKAYDDAIKKAAATTMSFSDIEKKAAQRRKEDPALKLEDALDKVERAFAQPEMIKAIDDIASKLPELAKALADLVSWAAENPWKAAAAGAGLNIGGSLLTGAAGAGLAAIFGKIAAASGLGGAAAAASGGAAAALPAWMVPTSASAAVGSTAGGLAAAGAGVLGAGAAGAGIGALMNKFIFNPRNQAYADILKEAQGFSAKGKGGVDDKIEALARIQRIRADLGTKFTGTENFMGSIASIFTDVKSPMEELQDTLRGLSSAQVELTKALNEQVSSLKGSPVKDFNRDVQATSRNLRSMVPSDNSRGTKPLPMTPGAAPVRG